MSSLHQICPERQALRHASRVARDRAWAPYSGFHVGAAILTDDRSIISGCNVENASYGLTVCAERVAVGAAVALGHRKLHAICISLTGTPVPCGACRQVLHEFNPNLLLLLDNLDGSLEDAPEFVTLTALLPRAFSLPHPTVD